MIVISDIHGCFNTFKALIDKCREKYPYKEICIAGDMIDRGPSSCAVVEHILNMGFHVVRGNHEQMMIDEGPRPRYKGIWISNGGKQCLDSYEITIRPTDTDELNEKEIDYKLIQYHIDWMKNLPFYIHFPNKVDKDGRQLLVTHAAASEVFSNIKDIEQGNISLQGEQDLLWNRTLHENARYNDGNSIKDIPMIYNVYGHTPCGPIVCEYAALIDSGACFGAKDSAKYMTAFIYPEKEIITQIYCD